MKRMTFVFLPAALAAAILASTPSALAPEAQDVAPSKVARHISTFSVVIYDPGTGEVGVAVESKFFAVGAVVPWCKAGIGAVATQAYGNPTYGPLGLEMLEEGYSPVEVMEVLLVNDEDRERRQIGIVAAYPDDAIDAEEQPAATYTGGECLDWAGGRTGVTPDGVVYAVQGNILTGPEVVDAMAAALEAPREMESSDILGELSEEKLKAISEYDLVGRMLRSLIAGQAAGGDSRGMQSAALKVSQAGAGYGGYTDVKYDLRVDDAEDPFEELARLINLARPFALSTEAYNLLYAGEYERSIRLFTKLVDLEPENAYHHYNLACALSLNGSFEAAIQELSIALDIDPSMSSHARGDPDLEPLHGMTEYEELVGEESG